MCDLQETPLVHLNLRTALEYEKIPELDPFACHSPLNEGAGELLFCFELDQEQAGCIDPQPDHFLGEIVFSGRQKNNQGDVRLTEGLYLFAQQKKALNRDECIDMAIEQQKDGLWERLHLESRLYIRRLFEDGSPVTQIFRPYQR